jgi:hypothetical protein
MDFFNDLPVLAKFFVAFIVVLAVLGAVGYLMRRFGGGALVTTGPRGRKPRLSVIEAASVDGRRRLVLVRRDDAEHLLLLGGPTDIVVEPNIGRAGAAVAAPAPAPATGIGWDPKPSPALEPMPRQPLSLEGTGWPPGEPTHLEPPTRPVRETFGRPVERQRLEALVEDAGAPPLLPTPPHEPEPAFEPPPIPPSFEPVFQVPPEPKRMPAAPPLPPRPAANEESNLAEMAQRLEAALRRPIKPVEPVPAPPSPGSRFTSAPAPLEMPPRPPRAAPPPPAPPSSAREPVPPPLPKEPDLKVVPADLRPGAQEAPSFTSIEEEMASLLGRSTGKP